MNPYLSGELLYGEDLSPSEIQQWFADEKDGYYNLTQTYRKYQYEYHALNIEHGFRHLPDRVFQNVLGIGSAYGDEFAPIVGKCGKITILEPSKGFANPRFEYVEPSMSGELPFADKAFDLITCLHVLHHVPKISFALKEIGRVLAPSGFALVSEPITSMGDWNYPRKGLTKHERGIPIAIFRKMISQAGLRIYRETRNSFSLTSRWSYLIRRPPYNQQFIVKLDKFLCRLPWFSGYHATGIRKLRVLGTYFVLTR